ncbi:MAG: hypothetical protein S4CHLAM81_09090 [Chlamydiales bacterium]|nr:hypothetical protein [Chlamydiales bacterium]MCH9635688.1 hypothetical protein [Chlamydiales bacterium]
MKRLLTFFLLIFAFNLQATEFVHCGCGYWKQYKQNFGMEKVTLSFPHKPTMSYSETMTTALAWDGQVGYSFMGYYPAVGNIDVSAFFDEMLSSMNSHPFEVEASRIYENTVGNWVLEYISYDHYRNLTIRGFSVVTPFNAYTLHCIHPQGSRERYSYYRDSFRILCECGY